MGYKRTLASQPASLPTRLGKALPLHLPGKAGDESLPSIAITLSGGYAMATEVGWTFSLSVEPWPTGNTIVVEYGPTEALGSVWEGDTGEAMLVFSELLNNETIYCRVKVTAPGYADSYSSIEHQTTNAGAEPWLIRIREVPAAGDKVVVNLANEGFSMGFFLDTGGAAYSWYTDRPEASERQVGVCETNNVAGIAAGLVDALLNTVVADGHVTLPTWESPGGLLVATDGTAITSITTTVPAKIYVAKYNEPPS